MDLKFINISQLHLNIFVFLVFTAIKAYSGATHPSIPFIIASDLNLEDKLHHNFMDFHGVLIQSLSS